MRVVLVHVCVCVCVCVRACVLVSVDTVARGGFSLLKMKTVKVYHSYGPAYFSSSSSISSSS